MNIIKCENITINGIVYGKSERIYDSLQRNERKSILRKVKELNPRYGEFADSWTDYKLSVYRGLKYYGDIIRETRELRKKFMYRMVC